MKYSVKSVSATLQHACSYVRWTGGDWQLSVVVDVGVDCGSESDRQIRLIMIGKDMKINYKLRTCNRCYGRLSVTRSVNLLFPICPFVCRSTVISSRRAVESLVTGMMTAPQFAPSNLTFSTE